MSATPMFKLPLTRDGVRIERMDTGQTLPVMARPTTSKIDKVAWVRRNTKVIEAVLRSAGALLFRGFGPASIDSFEACCDALITKPMDYEFHLVPRPKVSDKIFESTRFPPRLYLNIHNECSAQSNWPMTVAFACMIPATTGGETPLADCRKILARLQPEIQEKFLRLGITYIRDVAKSELSSVFGSTSTASIEAYCKKNNYTFTWDRHGGVHLRFHGQAIAQHPVTGESVWFNLARLYLVASYPFIRDPSPILNPTAAIPYDPLSYDLHACYGDGTPIEDETVFHIHNAYALEAEQFPWQSGDVLLLDNMLTAHGRNKFAGDRSVLLAMGDPHNGQRVPC